MSTTPGTAMMVKGDSTALATLKASIFPGASDDAINMAIDYCAFRQLDIMLKPVHLVPMKVKTGKKNAGGWDIKEDREVVMPGIGLYRIQAARTKEYAGIDEPVFGPTCSMKVNKKVTTWSGEKTNRKSKDTWEEVEIEYPEFCKITVYRIVGGMRCAFTAVEYWVENYATQSNETDAPNSMWETRSWGQLAKCAEAQALRKGFPEVGSETTAEEMAGKSFDDLRDVSPAATANEFMPKKVEPEKNEDAKAPIEGTATRVVEPEPASNDTSAIATESLIAVVNNKLSKGGLTLIDVKAKFSIDSLDGISTDKANAIIAWTRNPSGN